MTQTERIRKPHLESPALIIGQQPLAAPIAPHEAQPMSATEHAANPLSGMTRHDLITTAARAAFQIEAAERAGLAIEEARHRVTYHSAQAELLARTLTHDAAARAQVIKNREDHLRYAAAYQRELDRLEERDA